MSEFPNGQPALARYTRPSLFPHRVHRILDTTTRMADALRRVGCDRHPDASRFHRICALVWLFRVRIAFGQYWRVVRRGKRTEIHHRLHHLHQIVVSCYDSALVKMAQTTPFRDIRADERLADETWRSDDAVFDQARYPFLTDEELASITRGLEKRAFKVYCCVSDLRDALWKQLDRLHKFPRLQNTATAGGVDTIVRSESWRDVAPWREKVAYQFRSTSEAEAQMEGRTPEPPAGCPAEAPQARENGTTSPSRKDSRGGSSIGKTARDKIVKFFRESPKPEWKMLKEITSGARSKSEQCTAKHLRELVRENVLEHQKGKGLWRLIK